MSEWLKLYIGTHIIIGLLYFIPEFFDNLDFLAGITKFLFWPIYLICGIIKTIVYDIKNGME